MACSILTFPRKYTDLRLLGSQRHQTATMATYLSQYSSIGPWNSLLPHCQTWVSQLTHAVKHLLPQRTIREDLTALSHEENLLRAPVMLLFVSLSIASITLPITFLSQWTTCLSLFSEGYSIFLCVAMINHSSQEQYAQEKYLFHFHFHTSVPHQRKSGQKLKTRTLTQEWKQRPWWSAAYCLALSGSFSQFVLSC